MPALLETQFKKDLLHRRRVETFLCGVLKTSIFQFHNFWVSISNEIYASVLDNINYATVNTTNS
jgi:hypothetical protein